MGIEYVPLNAQPAVLAVQLKFRTDYFCSIEMEAMRAEMEAKRAEERAEMETKRAEKRKEMETKRAEMEANMKAKMEAKKAEFKAKQIAELQARIDELKNQ